MKRTYRSFAGFFFLTLAVAGCTRTSGGTPAASASSSAPAATPSSPKATSRTAFDALPANQREAYDSADAIVVATIVAPKIDTVLEVEPPITVHSFGLAIEKTLSGMPLPAARLTHSTQDRDKPFVAGARVIVAVRRVQQTLEGALEELSAVRVDDATSALEKTLADAFEPAPSDVRIAIAQIAPTKHIKYHNDYGDGVFELTITNDSKAARTIPELYTVHDPKGDQVLFDEAVVVREGGRTLRVSQKPRPANATPLTLAAGASVKARIDVKPLGVVNPAGGVRIYYSFGIGALRKSSFFYYTDSLHGPLMGKR